MTGTDNLNAQSAENEQSHKKACAEISSTRTQHVTIKPLLRSQRHSWSSLSEALGVDEVDSPTNSCNHLLSLESLEQLLSNLAGSVALHPLCAHTYFRKQVRDFCCSSERVTITHNQFRDVFRRMTRTGRRCIDLSVVGLFVRADDDRGSRTNQDASSASRGLLGNVV